MNLKQRYLNFVLCVIVVSSLLVTACSKTPETSILHGSRTLLDAHNCYPYNGKWEDRIDRALETGVPLAIEQDLVWFTDILSGESWSIISHGNPYSGEEPALRNYFFERIRPIVKEAIHNENKEDWPLIILNLDFKTNEPEHHVEIWELLGEYEEWLCTAERVSDMRKIMPIDVRPVLVLTGRSDEQQLIFHDQVRTGERLRLFGAVHTYGNSVEVIPEQMVPHGADNYRRWWNNPWRVVEKGGQKEAEEWAIEDMKRLQLLVEHAHEFGLWIRFYTLNGHDPDYSLGWSSNYNFGSGEMVKERWRAVIEAGVDFVATDQYERFTTFKTQIQGTNK